MKVVYLSPFSQMGGAERVLLDILTAVREKKPDWRLHLIIPATGPLADKVSALDIPFTILPFNKSLAATGDAGAGGPAGRRVSRASLFGRMFLAGPAAISYVRRLRKILAELRPDVIHTNGFKMHVLGIRARPRNTPVVWHIHDYVSSRPVMAKLLRSQARRCSLALANSRSVAEDARRVFGDRLSVQTIYNGIDLKCFSPTGPALDLDSLSGLTKATPGTVRFGLLATLARWKGHETFLRAISLIPEELPVRGYIIGGAIYQTNGSQLSVGELQELIEKFGLSQRVGLIGFMDQPASAMRSLDVIVHASTEPEPFGLVIAEGMACGRPVIVSNAGGAAELINKGVNSLCYTPGDATALAQCIKQLATEVKLRTKLGKAGRAAAEGRFDRNRLASELIEVYQKLNSSRSRALS